MRLAKFDQRLEPPLRALTRALGRLDGEQGKVARRNARRALRAAQRALGAKVDGLYPAPPKKKTKPWKHRTNAQRRVRLEKRGWKVVPTTLAVKNIAVAGIRMQSVESIRAMYNDIYAPVWAVTIATNRPRRLMAAKKDRKLRKALLVEIALEREGERNA